MFLKYASGQQLAIFIRSFQELLIRTLLSPEQIAGWNLMAIIASTVALFQTNIVAASNRLLSQLHGATASSEQLTTTRGNSIYLELFQQTLLSCALLLIAPWIWEAPEQLSMALYYCAAAVMVSNALLALLVGMHESSNSFGQLGLILPLNAFVQAVLIYLGTAWFSLPGLIGGAILGLGLNILILFGSLRLSGVSWRAPPNFDVSLNLGRTAASFRLADLPTSVFYLLDTILASLWLKPAELAFYVTARLLANFSSQVVFAANRVGLIRLGNQIGAKASPGGVDQFLSSQFIFVFLLLLPASVAVFEPAFRWGIPFLLPDYADSLASIPYLMLAGLTSSRSLFIRNYWIHKSQWWKITASGLGGLVGAVIVFALGKYWFGEIGIRELAILTFLSQIPYAIGLIVTVSSLGGSVKNVAYRLSTFLLSLIAIVVCLQANGAMGGIVVDSIFVCIGLIGLGLLIQVPFALTGWLMFRVLNSSADA